MIIIIVISIGPRHDGRWKQQFQLRNQFAKWHRLLWYQFVRCGCSILNSFRRRYYRAKLFSKHCARSAFISRNALKYCTLQLVNRTPLAVVTSLLSSGRHPAEFPLIRGGYHSTDWLPSHADTFNSHMAKLLSSPCWWSLNIDRSRQGKLFLNASSEYNENEVTFL